MSEEKTQEEAPECCKGCDLWEKHGKNCHYYWELKKECTMHFNKH